MDQCRLVEQNFGIIRGILYHETELNGANSNFYSVVDKRENKKLEKVNSYYDNDLLSDLCEENNLYLCSKYNYNLIDNNLIDKNELYDKRLLGSGVTFYDYWRRKGRLYKGKRLDFF